MPAKLLPSSPSLDHLKYQARDLLNVFKAGHAEALARIREFHPKFDRASEDDLRKTEFSLADAQLVIAREYGFESWPKLKRYIEASGLGTASEASPGDSTAVENRHGLVARFLEYACPDHHIRGGPAHVMAREAAVRLLKQHPEIARHSLYTAVVCGEPDEVRRIIAERPEAASEKYAAGGRDRSGAGGSEDLFKDNGPKRWEPLLYLCFARLPLAAVADNAVAIARLLLDHGASPNAYFMAGGSRYTPLVGVVGEGEEHRPPHQQRGALAQLLLERGAEPYDIQVLYNVHFHGDVLWFLKLIHAHAVKIGRGADWEDSNWPMLDMGGFGCGARFLLGIAVKNNDLELAAWCLSHGANPNAPAPVNPRHPKRSLHEEALRKGFTKMANLLVHQGATPSSVVLEGEEAFVAACLRMDREEARRILEEHPECLRSPRAVMLAAEVDRADVVALLLELGMSPNIQDVQQGGARPLHVAAYNDAHRVAALLIDNGAEIDPVDSVHDATPLWWAVWDQRHRTIELLSRYSRDVWALALMGKVERLRQLFSAEPALARMLGTETTPLMWLPGDETLAVEVVKLFLAHGADPSIKDREGFTAADLASKRGLDEAAKLLRAGARRI